MRNIDQFLTEYAKTHQNKANQLIHILCVPVILASTLAFGWPVSAEWLGVEAEWAPYANVATLVSALFMLLFYSRMGVRAFVAMAGFLGASLAAIYAIDAAGWPLITIAVVAWVAAWALQLVGHQIEGAKPSFFDDLVFLLIGPLFVLEEVGVPVRKSAH